MAFGQVTVGVPREVKEGERRVALLPRDVEALARAGCAIRVESGAGAGIGREDSEYAAAGARIVSTDLAWNSDLMVKVKELLPADIRRVRGESTVFCFHHLPGEPERTRRLAGLGIGAIAFEMVRDDSGGFPLLAPMSTLAGRMAVDAVAAFLPSPARVLVLGAGHAGLGAARTARVRGDEVAILTRSEGSRDAARREGFAAEIVTPETVARGAREADLVVGAVFVPAQPTPKLLPRALVREMKDGAVIADISIDAGGVAETSRPTTHAEPTYVEEGVVHYCVANIPAASPSESSAVLSAALRPFVAELATRGIAATIRSNAALREAVLLWKGKVTHRGIAAEAGLPYVELTEESFA